MALNTIHVSFDGQNETITKKRYQYDKGQVCVFDDIELPEAYKVIFSNNLTGENSIPMIGDENGVKVPDDFFLTGLTIYGWVYLSEGNDDGQTVKHFTIPIEKRVQETDEEPTPEEQTEIEQALVALNNAVAKTAADVETTTEKAEQAATSAQSAATSAEEASGYLEGVTAKANEAAASASSAAQSATTASQKAAETAAGVSRAEQAAEGAEAAKTAAQSAQTAAEGYAGAAGTSAQAASTSATQAAGSATSASGFAGDANTSAQAAASSATTASTKATEAAQSASTASTAATNAINAKTAAETAQGKAEDAQEAAETAQEAAETAVESVQGKSEQIDQNTEEIGDLKADINQLQDIVAPLETNTNLLDVSAWYSKTINNVVNNGDGTFSFTETNYGTIIWESVGIVPVGTYVLPGSPFGIVAVSTTPSWDRTNIATNNTTSDTTYTNAVARKLYLSLHLNSGTGTAFIYAPKIMFKDNAVADLEQRIGSLEDSLKEPFIYSPVPYAILSNADSIANINGRYAATLVSYTNDVKTFTFGDGSEVNPGISSMNMGLASKKWLVGFKYRMSKLSQSVSTPSVVRIYTASVYEDKAVVLDSWEDYSTIYNGSINTVSVYVRGFNPAPSSGQFQFEFKDYYIYDVTGLSNAMINHIKECQSNQYSDGTVRYTEGGEKYETDKTVSIDGKAADAGAVGDMFEAMGGIPQPPVSVPLVLGYINNNGEESSSTPTGNYCITDYIPLDYMVALSYTGEMGSTFAVFWFDENKTFISGNLKLNDRMAWFENILSLKPSNAKYVRLQSKTMNASNPPDIAPEATAYYAKNYLETLKNSIVGDGITDDTLALQKIVNMGNRVVLPSCSAILLRSPIYIRLGYSKIIDGNGVKIIIDGNFDALDVSGTLATSSSATGMDTYVYNSEADTLIRNFRITSTDGISGCGINITKAFKTKICDNYIYNVQNGVAFNGQCRDIIIFGNYLHSIYASGLLFGNTLNLHQCNIENNIIMYAHDCIHFDKPYAIANFQVVGNDLELGTYPPVTYNTAVCINCEAKSSGSQFSEIEITGNTLQGHNSNEHDIKIVGDNNCIISEISIGGNHISNTDISAIFMKNVLNLSIFGNTYKEIEGYVYNMDGSCENIVIVGEAARSIAGKIHAESTATLNMIKCKNVVFANNTNSIETSDVTNVDITDS